MLGTHIHIIIIVNPVSPKNEGGDASLFDAGLAALQLPLRKAFRPNISKQLDAGGVEPTFSIFGRCKAMLNS